MNISNCKEGQVVEINIGGEILRTKVTPNVKSNIIHTEAYLRVMDQLSDYLKNNPGIHQLRIWLNEMKTKVVETAKGKVRARGPFRIPISLEGVSTWMKVMVSDQEIFRRRPQLAQLKLGVNFLNRLISDTTKIELEDDFTLEATFRKPNDDQVSFNVLMDTGASPNVLTTGMWAKLGCPKLEKASIGLLVADQSRVSVLGRTPFIDFKFEKGAIMRARFYVIPTQGRDQAILGREFMRQFPISFEINAYTQSVLVPAEVDERPSEVVLERERKTEACRNETCENESQR